VTRWGKNSPGSSFVVDFVDIISATRAEQLSKKPPPRGIARVVGRMEHLKIRLLERQLARSAGALVVSTEVERDRAKHIGRPDIQVIPNTIDCTRWNPVPAEGDALSTDTLLMTGNFDHGINVDGAMFFLQQVWPRLRTMAPQARLCLAGGAPPAAFVRTLIEAGVEFRAQVEDMRPLFSQAALCIAPVVHGGGTPYKILEALATARPVVASPIAVRGFGECRPGGVIIATTATAFADACLSLLDSRILRQRLGEEGRLFVERCHDHAVAKRLWTHLYEEAG
jgi:glycosyltransferase involved in cell wall biosynthesis